MTQYLFQNCQKIILFSSDFSHVLLCKRKGEQDYDGIYSFIGGKMETRDGSLIEGMRREKEEEIGKNCSVLLYPTFNHMTLFKKQDGNHMLLPHYLAVFQNGEIELNEEYSEYTWVKIHELETFEPKIKNIFEITMLFLEHKDQLTTEEGIVI